MYTVIMDFDHGEIRIPSDVIQALDIPLDVSYLVHRSNRQLAITRYLDHSIMTGEKRRGPPCRKSRIAKYWRGDVNAYCMTCMRTTLQLIGNLISGFNGSGIYALTGSKEDLSGEPVILFDLAQATAFSANY